MKCINAEWELRNLGVRTIEISIEKKDSELPPEEILDAIEKFRREYDAKYLVVKVSTTYPSIGIELQKSGFLLMENQFDLKTTYKEMYKNFERYKKFFAEEVSYKVADGKDMEIICSEIEKGIFTTDRIALDEYFGVKIANHRYSLWVRDEWNRGATVCYSLFQGQPSGFFLYKIDEKKNFLHDTIGGCFKDFAANNGAAGAILFYAGRDCFFKQEWKNHKTAVSSNNLEALNLHLMFGTKIVGINNVLVKHFD